LKKKFQVILILLSRLIAIRDKSSMVKKLRPFKIFTSAKFSKKTFKFTFNKIKCRLLDQTASEGALFSNN